MKFFVDTADIAEIRELAATGLLDGVGREVDAQHVVAKAGKQNRVLARPATGVEHPWTRAEPGDQRGLQQVPAQHQVAERERLVHDAFGGKQHAKYEPLLAFMAQNGDPNSYVILDNDVWQQSDLKRHYNHQRLRSMVSLILMSPEFLSR